MTRDDFTVNVSIIIVNYNTKQLLADCLNSIYEQTKDINFEVIVSDNGSTDGSIEMLKNDFPQVILIENNVNLGFGAANNRGLAIAKGKYIFYLNSDTILLNNAVKLFFDYFEQNGELENLGALGCNLLDENFQITNSGGNFPTNSFIIKNLIGDYKQILKRTLFFFLPDSFSITKGKKIKPHYVEKTGNVDYIIGADLFLPNNEDAQYDENFFLYFEDTDLNMRLHKKSKNRKLIIEPKIQHLEHKSNKVKSKLLYYSSLSKIHYTISAIKFLRKYYNNTASIFISKLFVTFAWISPFLLKTNFKYLKEIWTI